MLEVHLTEACPATHIFLLCWTNWIVELKTVLKHNIDIHIITAKEVHLPLVPYCTDYFEKGLFLVSSTGDFIMEYELIHEHSD